ncbi:MAG TPA: hypothetical protein IAB84_12600 [Candidatus Choladousia intestinigallinarum]|nr:hypothetical protein [Candidatus Choladousia intestinigallinarum]
MVERDYVMRLIHEMIRALLKLVLHIDWREEEKDGTVQTVADSDLNQRYQKLKNLVEEKKINEAENLLYEYLDELDQDENRAFGLALLFYDLLTGLSDEYLEESGYTREEVTEGVTAAASRYGYERFAQELMEGDWDK